MKVNLLLIFPIAAYLIGRLAIRSVSKAALAVGFVDSPDCRRKLQETPVPLGGGLAVWLALWSIWIVGHLLRSSISGVSISNDRIYAILAFSSFLVLILGLIDDRYGMRGLHKLTGQLVSATILVGLGGPIEIVSGFGHELELGVLAFPVTIFWIILVVNAFNLIDGMDGFCGGLGLVALLTIAFLFYWAGRVEDALLALTVVGALAAFLKDNLPPARIYLGDAGSMTVGFLISVLSIRACTSIGPRPAVSMTMMVALVALPLLDVVTALGRRWLTGHSLFVPDRGHIHHRLRARLGNTTSALGVGVGLSALVTCGAALAKTWRIGDSVAGLMIISAIVLLAGTNTFGGSEIRLLIYRVRTLLHEFTAREMGRQGGVREGCHLVGVRNWSRIWEDLIEEAKAAGGRRVEVAIDLPSVGETYHGTWTSPAESKTPSNWSIVHTLQVGSLQAGTLWVSGDVDASRSQYLNKVEKLVRDLEDRLGEELNRDPSREANLSTQGLESGAMGLVRSHQEGLTTLRLSPNASANLGQFDT